jgi:hypothetical protein
MPKREQLLSQLDGERHYGVLLVTQMGGVPNEVQLMVETAEYDEKAQGLRPTGDYIIRALGVREHRVSVGLFARLAFLDEHPLLYHQNTPHVAVHFDGEPSDIHELVLDISQAYVSTFGPWRHLIEMEDDLNRTQPLVNLLMASYGLLGTMPKPLAERMGKVLAHHGMNPSLSEDANFETVDEHGRSKLAKLLLLDQSYVIALDFSVEQMGKGK